MIELLVVVGIILLLAAITSSVVNMTLNNDKVRAGARQVQSYLAGARDRAIYSGAPRGVRLLLDQTNNIGPSGKPNNRTVSSMVYIQATPPWTQGTVLLERADYNPPNGVADDFENGISVNPQAIVLRGFDNDPSNPYAIPTNWVQLYNQGLIYDGQRILIPNDSTGTWYTISTMLLANASNPGATPYYPPRLLLTTAFEISSTNTNGAALLAFINGGPRTYQLELPPSVMPGAEITQLPKGTVIHLDRCTSAGNLEQQSAGVYPNRGDKLPSAWKITPSVAGDPTNFDYTTQMDIMFTPRGVVTGVAAQRGIIHLYIADRRDADRDQLVYWSSPSAYPTASAPEYPPPLADKYERHDKVVVSIFTRTGAVSTHSIYSNADPFRFAETGEVAGK